MKKRPAHHRPGEVGLHAGAGSQPTREEVGQLDADTPAFCSGVRAHKGSVLPVVAGQMRAQMGNEHGKAKGEKSKRAEHAQKADDESVHGSLLRGCLLALGGKLGPVVAPVIRAQLLAGHGAFGDLLNEHRQISGARANPVADVAHVPKRGLAGQRKRVALVKRQVVEVGL